MDVYQTLWLTLVVDFVPARSLSYPLPQLPWAVAIDQRDEWHRQVVGDGGCYIEGVAVHVVRDQVALRDHGNRKEDGLSCLQGQGHASSLGPEQSRMHLPAEQAEASQDWQRTKRHHHSSYHGAIKYQSRSPRQAGSKDERSTAGNGKIDLNGVQADAQSSTAEHSW